MRKFFNWRWPEIQELLIEFIYLTVIFIIPVYFSAEFLTYNVFELPKLFIFKTLTIVFLLLTIIKFINFKFSTLINKAEIKKIIFSTRRYYLIPLIFIIGLGISVIFSEDIRQSFFGSYDRQAGFLSYFYYFLFFLLLTINLLFTRNFKNLGPLELLPDKIKRIIVTIILSGVLVSLYGILQILGLDFFLWPEDPLITRRVFSSLGQVNFLASWLLLVIPISFYLLANSRKLISKFFYLLIVLIQCACLFFTASRGGILAFFIVLGLFFLYIIIFHSSKKSTKFLLGIIFLITLLGGVFSFKTIFPGRWGNLVDLKRGSLAARVDFYRAAGDAILFKPFFGYGLDNSSQIFIERYQSDWGIHSNIGVKNDRAHNLFLDLLLAGGVFLLSVFLLLYYFCFRLVYQNTKYSPDKLSLALGLGLAGYLFSLLFSFSFVTGELYLFIFAALLLTLSIAQESSYKKIFVGINFNFVKNNLSNSSKIFIVIFLMSLAFGLIRYETRSLRADNYFYQLYSRFYFKDYPVALDMSEKIITFRINPVNKNYYKLYLGEHLSSIDSQDIDVSLKSRRKKYLETIDAIIFNNSFEEAFVKGKINLALANYRDAEKYFQLTRTTSPYWPKSYIELARLFALQEKTQEALVFYELAYQVLPLFDDERLNEEHRRVLQVYYKIIFSERGDLYSSLGSYEEAEKNYQAAYQADVYDVAILKKIANTYYLRHEFTQALHYILHGSVRRPFDYGWFLQAAILYKNNDDVYKAKEYFNKALALAPEEPILLQLINEY